MDEKTHELREFQDHRQIKQIALSGGGAKGTVYPGSYWALVEAGLLDGVNAVAGTSIGAVNAALWAAGISKEDYRKHFIASDLSLLPGKSNAILFGGYDGLPILKKVRRWINQSVISNLSALEKTQEFQKHTFCGKDFAIYRAIQDKVNRLNLEEKTLTFLELDFLHQHFPKHFKSLVILAVTREECEVKVFSASTTPDVDIALAVRASASVPEYFNEVIIDGKKYIDGAVVDNIPTEYFGQNSKSHETLVMSFKNQGLSAAMHGVPNPSQFDPSAESKKADELLGFAQCWGSNYKLKKSLKERHEDSCRRIHDTYALQTIVLDGLTIDLLNFKNANKFARELDMLGYLDAMDYIIAHELYQQEKFDIQFIKDIVETFRKIYPLVIDNPVTNSLVKEIDEIQEHSKISDQMKVNRNYRQIYSKIRELISGQDNPFVKPETFALTRAVEVHRGLINEYDLQKECADCKANCSPILPPLSAEQIVERLEDYDIKIKTHQEQVIELLKLFVSENYMSDKSGKNWIKTSTAPYLVSSHAKIFAQTLKAALIEYILTEQQRKAYLGYDFAHRTQFSRLFAPSQATLDRMLEDMHRAMICACKVLIIPEADHAPVHWNEKQYKKNLKHLSTLANTLPGHGSPASQALGMSLVVLGIAATLFFAFSPAVPLLARAVLAVCTQFNTTVVVSGVCGGTALVACGSALFATQGRQGLAKATDDLVSVASSPVV